MRKRRVCLVLITVGVILGALVWRFRQEREPEYGGKRLSEWVGPPHQRYGRGGVSVGLTEPAQEAILRIGTNALPFLMKWMRFPMPNTPPWKRKLYGAIRDVSHRLNGNWNPPEFTQLWRANGAEHALIILGAAGHAPVRDLSQILNDPKATGLRVRVAGILAVIGKDGMPPLLSAMTNPQLTPVDRMVIFDALDALGTNKEAIVPALQSAMKDPNPNIRIFATNALEQIDPEALERATR